MAKRGPTFRVRALTIVCTNPERSVQFYREVLGAAVLPADNGAGWWFRLGSLDLNLLSNAAEPSPAAFPPHAMPILWLEVPDLATAEKWFARHGTAIVDPGAWAVHAGC